MKLFLLSKRGLWIAAGVFLAAAIGAAVAFGEVVHVGGTTAVATASPPAPASPTVPPAVAHPVPGTHGNVYQVGAVRVEALPGVALSPDSSYGIVHVKVSNSGQAPVFVQPTASFCADGKAADTSFCPSGNIAGSNVPAGDVVPPRQTVTMDVNALDQSGSSLYGSGDYIEYQLTALLVSPSETAAGVTTQLEAQ